MGKSVLISINPVWCNLIANGEKTLEIRKNKPRQDVPFKCYIYCTKAHGRNPLELLELHRDDGKIVQMNGKIIGEFICDSITEFSVPYPAYQEELPENILKESCLRYIALHRYALISNNCNLFAWHISDLKIYDEPKNLDEFGSTRPPQSWGYINE